MAIVSLKEQLKLSPGETEGKPLKTPGKAVGILVWIRNRYLPNTNQPVSILVPYCQSPLAFLKRFSPDSPTTVDTFCASVIK
jgi:hypothetical protein